MNPPTVTLTYGLPASGKTTRARKLVKGRTKRVSLDDFRLMLGAGSRRYNKRTESTVQDLLVSTTVKLVADGFGVVVDNCHLNPALPEKLRQALGGKVDWAVIDCSRASVATCISRDRKRSSERAYDDGGSYVGAEAIDWMHSMMVSEQANGFHLSTEWLADSFVPKPYVADKSKRKAIIVGVDGTLADRGPFERGVYTKKEFRSDVARIVRSAAGSDDDAAVIVCSDRPEELRRRTEDWLREHEFRFDQLLMRGPGDRRPDSVVKAELFDAHVRDRYNVVSVFDDRDGVANGCWRAMGLRTLQVADGNF
jgi:predicted kinase